MKEKNIPSIRLDFANCTQWNIMQLLYVTWKDVHNFQNLSREDISNRMQSIVRLSITHTYTHTHTHRKIPKNIQHLAEL